ncbi:MAG: SAF domain-containing protein, partial [Olsenella sp.]
GSVTAGTPLCAYRVSEDGAEVISADIEVLVAPVERTGISSASTITIAVPSSDVPRTLSASAEGSLRLVVPADDVEAVVEGVVAAPSVVSAEGGEAA